jgi:hypothetical protein
MPWDEHRQAGAQAAKNAGAAKTAALIGNGTSTFAEILKTATAEIGVDAVVSQLLAGPAVWAHMALAYIPDLGDRREALLNKASEAPEGVRSPGVPTALVSQAAAPQAQAASATTMGGPLSSMHFYNAMGAITSVTVEWMHGQIQPTQFYPDWNTWWWHTGITAGCDCDLPINQIQQQVPNAPLSNGDTVWIYVFVDGGTALDGRTALPGYTFTYDSGSTVKASFRAWGITTINHLEVQSYG